MNLDMSFGGDSEELDVSTPNDTESVDLVTVGGVTADSHNTIKAVACAVVNMPGKSARPGLMIQVKDVKTGKEQNLSFSTESGDMWVQIVSQTLSLLLPGPAVEAMTGLVYKLATNLQPGELTLAEEAYVGIAAKLSENNKEEN